MKIEVILSDQITKVSEVELLELINLSKAVFCLSEEISA